MKGAWDDIVLPHVLINGSSIKDTFDVGGKVTDAKIVLSIEQASTIEFTVFDPAKVLLKAPLLTQRTKCTVQDHKFSLAAVDKNDDMLTITFENNAIALLRRHAVPRKAARAKVTRAQFAQMLVKEEPTLTFYAPELKIKQPISNAKKIKKAKAADEFAGQTQHGFPDKIPASIKYRGQTLTKQQLTNLDAAIAQWNEMSGVNQTWIPWGIAIGFQESSWISLDNAHSDSTSTTDSSMGIFQQQKWWGPDKVRMDPAGAADLFMSAVVKYNKSDGPGITFLQVVENVQNPASQYVKDYAPFLPLAKKIYALWNGSDEFSTTASTTNAKPYEFHRGGPGQRGEDSWQCLDRLAKEVNWLTFAVNNTIYFISAVDLYTSRPIGTFSEASPGVEHINFSYDIGKNLSQATINCHAAKWQIDPGAVVMLEDCGPADGRWIVSEISRSLFDTQAEISLVKPTRPLPEPQSTGTNAAATKATKLVINGELGGPSAVAVGISFISSEGYLFGANHGGPGTVSLAEYLKTSKSEKAPFDCSSFVRWCWVVGGHIELGTGNVQSQADHARTTNWKKGGPGTRPPGGFQEGDILCLHNFTHTVMCAGGGLTIEAHCNFCSQRGITQLAMPLEWDYWYRPEPAAT